MGSKSSILMNSTSIAEDIRSARAVYDEASRRLGTPEVKIDPEEIGFFLLQQEEAARRIDAATRLQH